MTQYRVKGGQPLSGTITAQGSKNAALPLMAAGLLFRGGLNLVNLPAIRDVNVMRELLAHAGAPASGSDQELTFQTPDTISGAINPELARKLRASILLLGPILARTGHVELPVPGGDLIGQRPIDTHLRAFELMGATVTQTPTGFTLTGQLQGADIYLSEASVTATENILMAAALAQGTTILRNAAQEIHVQILAETLRAGGTDITGIGTSTLMIRGTNGQLLPQRTRIAIPADELDAATFAAAALITNGSITVTNYPGDVLRPFTEKLLSLGAKLTEHNQAVTITRASTHLKPYTVKVGPAPGFPTDLQPIMAVLATQADGQSLIHDWMYEQRFGYAEQLARLGATIHDLDPHRISISGPTPLTGGHISALDIRAGIACVLAALAATGETVIDDAQVIERGYAELPERLTKLGAHITREGNS